MEFTPKQQTVELIKKNKNILILTKKDPDGDAIGGAIGLKMVLQKMGKQVSIACPDVVGKIYQFLPNWQGILQQFSGSRNFIISIDTSETQVDKLSYRVTGNILDIILTPLRGQVDTANIKFNQGEYRFDLIIVLDCPDLDHLGQIFEANSEIFYEKPVINIDHHSSNDYFGKVNLVDITATSTCEILISLTEALGGETNFLDEDIATCFLCGIIYDTNSFQNSNTTPKSFTVAAQLVAAGARQQQIVRYLYKTKSLSQLRLWGRILAQVREDKGNKLVWSFVLARDLEQTQAEPQEVPGVLDELLSSAPGAEIIILFVEEQNNIHVHLRTVKGIEATKLAEMFGGRGNSYIAEFILENKKIGEAEKEVLAKIKEFQAKRLGGQQQNQGTTLVSQLPHDVRGSSPIEKNQTKQENISKESTSKPSAVILSQRVKEE